MSTLDNSKVDMHRVHRVACKLTAFVASRTSMGNLALFIATSLALGFSSACCQSNHSLPVAQDAAYICDQVLLRLIPSGLISPKAVRVSYYEKLPGRELRQEREFAVDLRTMTSSVSRHLAQKLEDPGSSSTTLAEIGKWRRARAESHLQTYGPRPTLALAELAPGLVIWFGRQDNHCRFLLDVPVPRQFKPSPLDDEQWHIIQTCVGTDGTSSIRWSFSRKTFFPVSAELPFDTSSAKQTSSKVVYNDYTLLEGVQNPTHIENSLVGGALRMIEVKSLTLH